MLLSRWFRIGNSIELESRSRFLKDRGEDRMKYIDNYFRSYIKFYKSTMVVATGSVNVLKTTGLLTINVEFAWFSLTPVKLFGKRQ